MKVDPKLKAATTARVTAVMFAGMMILIGQSPAALAQYGPRAWSPPSTGTFFSLQLGGTNYVPSPFLPFDPIDVPVYPVLSNTNWFVYDDTDLDLSSGGSQTSSELTPPGDGDAWDPPAYVRTYGSNDLWIELLSVDTTNQQAHLLLHGTVPDDRYQLLATNQLSSDGAAWTLSEIISGTGSTNQTPFSPFNIETNSQMFFRAHHADPVVAIYQISDAIEPNPTTGEPARSGFIGIESYQALTTDLPVYYTMRGTAQSGVEYSNLAQVVTLSSGNLFTNIEIIPREDNLVEGVETVIVSIKQTNGYLIDPTGSSATVLIKDSPIVVSVYFQTNAIEPDGPPGVAAQIGAFKFFRNDDLSLYPEMTVYYAVTGTASNGVDYVLLTNSFVFPEYESIVPLEVTPLADSILEGTETVTVTLVPTNTYLVDPNQASQTVNILESSTTVSIAWIRDAIETNSTLHVGQTGIFRVSRTDSRGESPSLSVHYQVSGTASNGLDYATLSGTVTLASGAADTNVFVETLPDNLIEGDETVILTVVPNGDQYYVSQANSSATVTIRDSVYFLTVTNLPVPVGMDYHVPSNSLLVSLYGSGVPGVVVTNIFKQIYTNITTSGGARTNLIVANWSGVVGVTDEVKMATVKMPIGTVTNSAGFTNGDLFFASSTGIGWVAADGTRSNLDWCVLTNSTVTNVLLLRGGLCVDQTGTFSNKLIAVTSSGDTPSLKGVWSVDSNKNPYLLTQIFTAHLEGVTTLTNDVQRWGLWAGTIITGDEAHTDPISGVPDPLIYTISTNGAVGTYHTKNLITGGIFPEDFDVIPANQNLYITAYEKNIIMELPAQYFVEKVGDLLITQAGEGAPPGLFIVHWNSQGSNFVISSIPIPSSVGNHIEHVTFAPLPLPAH